MTPKERAVMQQALEALHNTQNALLFVSGSIEQFIISNMTADAHDDADKAITALREALDHSGEADEMVVGWDRVKPEAIASDPLYQQGFVDGVEEGRNQVAEQAKQEPVAWMSPGKERLEFSTKSTVYGSHTIPLYAAPLASQVTPVTQAVRTKDLTDDEIMKINVDTAGIVPTCDRQFHFARAVIAADRELNK